jgi:S-adenosylmethionine synthetase
MATKPIESRIVTCESMTTGHPDKLCDQISDALLDAQLIRDPYVRCGIEAAASANEIWVFGQVASRDPLQYNEIVKIVRRVIRDIGYESAEEGIDPDTCTVRVTIDPQSTDIAMGVVRDDGVLGASDQGIVYGYATNETPEGLPLPLVLAQRLTRALTTARTTGAIPWLRPDGKAQVSVRYVGNTPQEVTAFVVSAQHRGETLIEEVRSTLEALAREVLGEWVTPNTTVHINPTGRFVVGGPLADSGLTGRKVIADTYGGVAHHGGGAFSGKDGTKVDRSAAYAARQAALHLVRSKLAARAEIAIAYAIGVDKPVAVSVDTFSTGTILDEQLAELVTLKFDLRPAAMIDRLELRTPLFERTARDGHVGHADLPWEHENEIDPKTEFLKSVAKRAGASQGAPGRFPCGHLQRLGKEHLAVGESFPYGAQGAELLACVVCESTERSI